MANLGSSTISAIKEGGILDVFMYPADSIPEGYVCVFDTVFTDNKSVVLPNNATALGAGTFFAGISAMVGPTVVGVDNQILVQKLGIAKCALKPNTAVIKGQLIGYDPADGGTVKPVDSRTVVPIGISQQSMPSSTSVTYFGVELHAQAGIGADQLVGDIITTSGNVGGVSTETAFNQSIVIPANSLQVGSVLRIRAKARVTGVNTGDKVIVRARLGGLSGVALGATPFSGGGVVPVVDSLANLDIVTTIRSSTVLSSSSIGGIDTSLISFGTTDPATFDATISNTLVITAQWNSINAANQISLFDLVVTQVDRS